MSTSDLRERLRKLAERTARELQASQNKKEQGDQSAQSTSLLICFQISNLSVEFVIF